VAGAVRARLVADAALVDLAALPRVLRPAMHVE
jgi:hypothetical protein